MIPDWNGAESWPDFVSVKELFNHSKDDIAHILTNMQVKARKFEQPIPEVLFSIPVFHFAEGIWEPFKDATGLLSCDTTKLRQFKETTNKW